MAKTFEVSRRHFLKAGASFAAISGLGSPAAAGAKDGAGKPGSPERAPETAESNPEQILPAVNEVELWQQVGQQPYEMTWVQRKQNLHTVVDFQDMAGWTLELYSGAKGELRRSREQQMWGHYVCKVAYSGAGPQSRVVARPPAPVVIPERFNSIDVWGFGDRWSYISDPSTPEVEISILVKDERNDEIKIDIAHTNWKQWWLIHRRVPSQTSTQMVFPALLSGIEISKIANRGLRYFFLNSLAFYSEELQPLKFAAQPKRNLLPFAGQIAGLNTGSGVLPFPVCEQTILPSNFEKGFQVRARAISPNKFRFEYRGGDGTVIYTYRPQKGKLDEISANVDGGLDFRPLDGGGLRFIDTPPGGVAEGELIEARLSDGVVRASFRLGSRVASYNLRLWQKSLVLDASCEGGEATELSFGRVSGVTPLKLITVPYITYSITNPRVLMSGSKSNPVFTSVWFDWYRSNASEPYAAESPQVTADSAEINGGMRYNPKTDGLRNRLCERVFITSSKVYEETFPTISNPPSIRQEEGKQYIWTVTAPLSFVKDHERCQTIRSYGLDKIMQHSHEVTWRDEGDSNTLKLHAAPQKGGDAMLEWYVKAQNDMGWLQGVYTNYTDFCTVNTNWNPDGVQRTPEGEWRRAWTRDYAIKPAKAVEYDKYYAQRIKKKFGVKMSYTDVHTAVSPWRYCDYDERVPGAGTLAATFYAYGQLLRNDQEVYGPTQSEGTYQWLYAGLPSGNYGWAYTDVNLLTAPPDVSFRLQKIHPLEADYGMGETGYYLSRIDKQWATSSKRREYIDLFLATTIAYGNMGWLVTEVPQTDSFAVEVLARSYYMMQQLQQQYAFLNPRLVEYANRNGKMFTPSQALSTGVMAESRLHVVYDNGTHVYVNRSATGNWNVKDGTGNQLVLPPSGWLVFNSAQNFYEISARVNGKRIDYVNSAAYQFLDGRGEVVQLGELGVTGSAALRRKKGGVVELIDIYGNPQIRFRSQTPGAVIAYSPSGEKLGDVKLVSKGGGWKQFSPVSGARRYVFAPPGPA